MTQDFHETIGQKIRAARIAAKLTQVQLADALSLSQSAVSQYERGWRGVDIPTVLTICQVTHHPLAYFLGDFAKGLHAVDDELASIVADLESAPELIPEVAEYIDFLLSRQEKVA
jgi:transcriptional regulator with XRE-family HTH domain